VIDRFHHLFIAPADFDASLAFYRDILGWVVTESWGGSGEPLGAILSGGGMKLVISEAQADDGMVRPLVHLDIHDIDKRFATLPKGAHIVRPPESTRWGTRWFVVRDPDGTLIAFEEVHGRGS
jgi:catechol 2,3-dioxygenase-like lactoylglutathione lyase family enzyme